MSGQNNKRLTAFTSYAEPELRDEQGKLVAVIPAYADSDARRLAACWNACQGIPTDTLERHYGDHGGLDAALDEASLRDQVDTAKQRDALASHLRDCIASLAGYRREMVMVGMEGGSQPCDAERRAAETLAALKINDRPAGD